MPYIHVAGGHPLRGTVTASGSKNAALPLLAATLLSTRPVTLTNVPDLQDVSVMCAVLDSLGVHAQRSDGSVTVDSTAITNTEPPYELVNRMRASFLVLGALLARCGEAEVPLPGGCEIGVRPVDEHLRALALMGAEWTQESGRIVAHAAGGRLHGAEIYLTMPSVGATENVVMAATLADGTTTVHNCALEPEVTDLCGFLTACGANIEGAGGKTITIHGVAELAAPAPYTVIPDRIEAGTYLLAIAGTGGAGTVHGALSSHLEGVIGKLREAGAEVEEHLDAITVAAPRRLTAVGIRTDAFPGFPTDLQPQFATVLACAQGVSTVHETVFEKRMGHVAELHRMGAQLALSGDALVITGVPGLSGVPVEATDLRGAAALVIAGLMAEGETRIAGLHYLLRGYERLPEKMAQLGGEVTYVYEPENQLQLFAAAGD